MHSLLSQPAMWVVLTMLSIAAITDLRTGLIPNPVVAVGAAAGVLVQLLAVALGSAPLGTTLLGIGLGFVVCSIVPVLLYAAGALGGGDLKLFAAIGVCAGPSIGLDIQLWAHVVAAALLPFYFMRQGGAGAVLRTSARLLANAFRPAHKRKPIDAARLTSLRFAPAIFLAAVFVIASGGTWS